MVDGHDSHDGSLFTLFTCQGGPALEGEDNVMQQMARGPHESTSPPLAKRVGLHCIQPCTVDGNSSLFSKKPLPKVAPLALINS